MLRIKKWLIITRIIVLKLITLRFFIKQGLKPERLFASGYGSFKPLDNKNNEKSRSKNRRIEIKITQKLGS